MLIQFTDYDFLKSNPNFKIIEEQPIYFDNTTFQYNPEFMYWGILNISSAINSSNEITENVQLSKSTNPVLFHNIIGDFTFIGIRIKFINKQNRDYSVLAELNVNEFNLDYSSDFNV